MKGCGRFIEIRIMEQHNDRDVVFRGKARLDDPEAVRELFRHATARGFEMDYLL